MARVRTGGPGAAGGRLGEGSELERGGAAAAAAATAAAKRPCCVVCGAGGGGEEEEGAKPSEETGETPHTAQDGRRDSSNPSCQAARRGPGARCCAGSGARSSRRASGERGGRRRSEAAARGCRSPRQRCPGSPGPRRPWLRCGSRGCAAGRRPAPWAGGCGGRAVPETRGRVSRRRWRPRFDPVSCSPAPFIVLCPWEEKHDVLEGGREGLRVARRFSTRSPGCSRREPNPPGQWVGPPRSLCTACRPPGCPPRLRGEGGGRATEPLPARVSYFSKRETTTSLRRRPLKNLFPVRWEPIFRIGFKRTMERLTSLKS